MVEMYPVCRRSSGHTYHSYVSSEGIIYMCSTQTCTLPPACSVPELANRRRRCWSECHGWVNPKKGSSAQQLRRAELLLSWASRLDGTRGSERRLTGRTNWQGCVICYMLMCQRSPTDSNWTSPRVVRGRCHGALSNTRAVTRRQRAYREN